MTWPACWAAAAAGSARRRPIASAMALPSSRRTGRPRPVAAAGRGLLEAPGAQAPRPGRPRPRLHLAEHLPALVRADRGRARARGPDHGRADPGPAVQPQGEVPPVVRGPREP